MAMNYFLRQANCSRSLIEEGRRRAGLKERVVASKISRAAISQS
jgi:hypothetical protein